MINTEEVVEVRFEKFDVIDGYYAPLIPTSSWDARSPILVKAGTREELFKLAKREKIMGLVQFGIENDDEARKALNEANLRLTENYLILEPDKAPDLGMSFAMLTMGVLIGAYLLRHGAKNSNDGHSVPPAQSLDVPLEELDRTVDAATKSRADAFQPVSR